MLWDFSRECGGEASFDVGEGGGREGEGSGRGGVFFFFWGGGRGFGLLSKLQT